LPKSINQSNLKLSQQATAWDDRSITVNIESERMENDNLSTTQLDGGKKELFFEDLSSMGKSVP
jgi:hypothetical protein